MADRTGLRLSDGAPGTGLFQAVVDSSPVGLWVTDLDSAVLHVNPAGLDYLGQPDVVEPSSMDSILESVLAAGDLARVVGLRESVLRSGMTRGAEIDVRVIPESVQRNETRVAEVTWLRLGLAVVYDATGASVGLLHRFTPYQDPTASDPQGEARAPDDVAAAAARPRAIGTWIWNGERDGVITATPAEDGAPLTEGFEALSAGQWEAESLHPEDRSRVAVAVARWLDDGTAVQLEFRVRDLELGVGWLWMRVRALVHRDASGRARRVSGSYQDVTEVKDARAAMQTQARRSAVLGAIVSETQYAATYDAACLEVRALLLGHGMWREVHCLVPAVSSTGAGSGPGDTEQAALVPIASRTIGRRLLELATRAAASTAAVWSDDDEVLAIAHHHGERLSGVTVLVGPLGPTDAVAAEKTAQVVAAQLGQVAARVADAERLSAARAQALAATPRRSEFLATMSHELRTPLNGIVGLNDLLLRTALEPDQLSLASGVQVAGRALVSVLNDVLDFSRIEAGELELARVDFEPRHSLDQLVRMLGAAARERGVELICSCAADVPEVVSGDADRLLQVLANLTSNAIKFSEDADVEVRISRDLEADPDSDSGAGSEVEADHRGATRSGVPRCSLLVEVCDRGIGIDPDDIERLFEPFVQAEASNARRYGGSGLGLAIARQVVTALGGDIGYRPRPDGGSIFAVTLDLDAPRNALGPLDEYARTWLGGRRVLVVHQGVSARERLGEQLDWWRMRTSWASGPDDALAELRASVAGGDGFDAVLIALGGRIDLRLAAAVAEDGDLDETAMIVLAAQDVDQVALRDTGVSACLNRPVAGDELRGILLEQLAGVASQPFERAVFAPAGTRRRLLVVEDNPVNQMVATGLLESMGYDIDVAGDGAVALEMLVRSAYDGVLMDVQMPVLDGYATTRALRAADQRARTGQPLPVIAMTASAVDGERKRCLDSGMDDFLTKPVDPVALAATLERRLAPVAQVGYDEPFAPESTRSQPGPLPPTPPIEGLDTDRLDVLRDLDPGDTTYLDRAIANFRTNSAEVLDAIRERLGAGDAAGVQAAAHKIAGSALNLGVNAAGEAAREVELLATDADLAALSGRLDALAAEMSRARELLDVYQTHYAAGPADSA